jgi:hypothetical protein
MLKFETMLLKPDRPVRPVRPGTGHSTGPGDPLEPLNPKTGQNERKTVPNRLNRWTGGGFVKPAGLNIPLQKKKNLNFQKKEIFYIILFLFQYFFP